VPAIQDGIAVMYNRPLRRPYESEDREMEDLAGRGLNERAVMLLGESSFVTETIKNRLAVS